MDLNSYHAFIAKKHILAQPAGFEADEVLIPRMLFDWQKEIVRKTCRIGRAAIFASCGLGKSAMQLAWAKQVCAHTGGNVLILAPLAVGAQTVEEGQKFGIDARYIRSMTEIDADCGIYLMNYEMLDHVDVSKFCGIVLDESSILKSLTGKTRTRLIKTFRGMRYKLCCTATPAPNDYTELGNHSDFLSVKSTQKMLATWFINDGDTANKWRLKRHAEKDFWAWVASWAISLNKPSDLSPQYDDAEFQLPKLNTVKHELKSSDYYMKDGCLVPLGNVSATDIKRQMRSTLAQRVEHAAQLVRERPDESWLIWCELNSESEDVTRAIPGAVEITGSMPSHEKAQKMLDFASGKIKVLVTKPKIAGFGMNWQICHNVIFVGVSFSFESYYQAVRRCWRFGQTHEVNCHVILCNNEGKVFAAVEEKEKRYCAMAQGMSSSVGFVYAAKKQTMPYGDSPIKIPAFLQTHGSVA